MALGPFPAPEHLRFAVKGGAAAKNEVFLVLQFANFRLPIKTSAPDVQWTIVDYDMPLGWQGWSITLNASSKDGHPLAISAPFGWKTGGTRQFGLAETLAAWLANGLLYGALFSLAAYWLVRKALFETYWVPIVSGGAVALLGYAAFWAYFASPILGIAFSFSIFSATAATGVVLNPRFDARDREWAIAGSLAALIGTLYIGVLHLFAVKLDFYELAQNRFVIPLPGDNRLPFDFADLLYHGTRPKELGAGWLSSDRPPLEEGWQFIAWPVTRLLGLSDKASSGTSAIWFQLLWVFSAWGLLRNLRMTQGRAFAWIAVMAMNGFFLINTLYTWPKLSAAALVCGAFGIWVMNPGRIRVEKILIGSVLAALGLLSHGGVAFSLIALVPWVILRCVKDKLTPWVLAAAAFLATVLPWTAYQYFFAPPGDRLLKWHLAGQTQVDGRSLWATLRGAYESLSWRQIFAQKGSNVAFQFGGDWVHVADWSPLGAPARRATEMDHSFRALSEWNVGLLLMVASSIFALRQRSSGPPGRRDLFLWAVLSMGVWCLLLFSLAIIPQGSLAVMISLFAVCASSFESAGQRWLWVIALVQAFGFATTWWPGNSAVGGSISTGSTAFIAAAATLLVYRSQQLIKVESPDIG